MENLLNKNHINTFLDLEFAKNNKQRRQELIRNFSTMPLDEPFTQRLNDFIVSWYIECKEKVHFEFVSEDDFNPKDIKGTLNRYIERYKNEGIIKIWTGASENSVFGNPVINIFNRCLHDWVHITQNAGFDFAGESITASIQSSILPSDWLLEKEILTIDVVGFFQYYKVHRSYVLNQRQFIIDYLTDPAKAIFTKQG